MLDSAAVSDKTTYRDSGVDIDAQDEALREVRRIVRDTYTPGVLSDIGSFGGLFRGTFEGIESPILVSSTDGVGTKLRVAQAMKIHDTVGYDLVCHCVNDILVQGARPLFFLDYYATGKLRPPVMTDVIRGMARACKENGCALIGVEARHHPRRRRREKPHRRQARGRGRCTDRVTLGRPAHERLLTRTQGALRQARL